MTTTFAMAPVAVQKLLDRVIYEAVAECVDFAALARLENMLVTEIADVCETDVERAIDVAQSIIERAWQQIAEDARRAEDGHWDACERREQEARERRS